MQPAVGEFFGERRQEAGRAAVFGQLLEGVGEGDEAGLGPGHADEGDVDGQAEDEAHGDGDGGVAGDGGGRGAAAGEMVAVDEIGAPGGAAGGNSCPRRLP